MEMEGAAVLWGRSIEKHNFRYTYMVSDGDSKAYAKVFEMNVYGEDVQVKKLDCVGHVQKCMGKRLLNLKSVTKGKLADGKTIGGRGRLTEAIIKKIQWYYGLAIRQNVLKIANPTQNQKDVAVYQMKKKHFGYFVPYYHQAQSVIAASLLSSRSRFLVWLEKK